MKWLVDNNVPRGVTTLLLDLGYEAAEVREALADNAPDSEVAAYAAAEGLLLDFEAFRGEVRVHRPRSADPALAHELEAGSVDQ